MVRIILVGGSSADWAVALNFGWVSLSRRLATYGFHREAQVASDLGEQYVIVKSVRERTPENACIAIRSQNPSSIC